MVNRTLQFVNFYNFFKTPCLRNEVLRQAQDDWKMGNDGVIVTKVFQTFILSSAKSSQSTQIKVQTSFSKPHAIKKSRREAGFFYRLILRRSSRA